MPSEVLTDVEARADAGFLKTCDIVRTNGDCRVTYAISNPLDSVVAAQRALDYLAAEYPEDSRIPLSVDRVVEEGSVVCGGKPMMYISGSLAALARLETPFAQRLGFACASAWNAFAMCRALPRTSFVATDAPYCAGDDMQLLAAYGASVGSRTARMMGAKGFLGSSIGLAAPMFGGTAGAWTMPHELIGYAKARILARGGDPEKESAAVEATKLYAKAYPDEETLTVLIDYDGREISDALAVARWLRTGPDSRRAKTLAVRLDTDDSRYLQGLDRRESVETLCRWMRLDTAGEVVTAAMSGIEYDAIEHVTGDIRDTCLFGSGVTAAAAVRLRRELDGAGFQDVRIILSGGFDAIKCRIFGNLDIQVDVIGTGAFLPADIRRCRSTLDAVRYEFAEAGALRSFNIAKSGREHLLLGPASDAAPPAERRGMESATILKPSNDTNKVVLAMTKAKTDAAD